MNSSTATRPIRTTMSFKQHERYLLDIRDELCQHYRLDKSNLLKFLLKKDYHQLKNTHQTLLY